MLLYINTIFLNLFCNNLIFSPSLVYLKQIFFLIIVSASYKNTKTKAALVGPCMRLLAAHRHEVFLWEGSVIKKLFVAEANNSHQKLVPHARAVKIFAFNSKAFDCFPFVCQRETIRNHAPLLRRSIEHRGKTIHDCPCLMLLPDV